MRFKPLFQCVIHIRVCQPLPGAEGFQYIRIQTDAGKYFGITGAWPAGLLGSQQIRSHFRAEQLGQYLGGWPKMLEIFCG